MKQSHYNKPNELDISEDGIYRVKDGQLTILKKPESGFGKHVITWQNGKISFVETTYTEK